MATKGGTNAKDMKVRQLFKLGPLKVGRAVDYIEIEIKRRAVSIGRVPPGYWGLQAVFVWPPSGRWHCTWFKFRTPRRWRR